MHQEYQKSTAIAGRFSKKSRKITDHLVRWGVNVGGLSIIGTLMLLFGYLIYEVVPLFYQPKIELIDHFQLEQLTVSEDAQPAHTLMDELAQLHVQVTAEQLTVRRKANQWQVEVSDWPAVPSGAKWAIDPDDPHSMIFIKDGAFQWRKLAFVETFDEDNHRVMHLQTTFPNGDQWSEFANVPQSALSQLAFRETDGGFLLAAVVAPAQLVVKRWAKEQSFLSDEMTLNLEDQRQFDLPPRQENLQAKVVKVLVEPDLRWLYVIYQDALMQVYDLHDESLIVPYASVRLGDHAVTSATFLLGSFSLLIGDESGAVTQWMPVRDQENQYRFQTVRTFELFTGPVMHIIREARRKGFFAIDQVGQGAYVYTTSESHSLSQPLMATEVQQAALSPRGDYLWVQHADQVRFYGIMNPHPDVSWKSLWQKVWYEGYQTPEYIWQSSASNNDFEAKFSLTPLSFGTLKAAFYAMLLAMPLAICGAIFTAYFMAPALRTKVKPVIEMMEALPTVILGFLAGLWLAPLVEQKLPGIFVMLIALPVLILLVAFIYSVIPRVWRDTWIRTGWEPLWLVPVIVFGVWLSMSVSDPIQQVFFNGDVRVWLTQELGVNYDQRNALVVGFVMGFAVIPTIFSIAEDALFAVPKHLSFGSLALGATSWQTLVRVVLPTASPGIFSAVMIGFGRAIGETMIVLMATGNTPIMDINIFEGFRTLSANIAVEMPEAEVGSSHYRILFLAALVLLGFTFVLNTTAELIRQNLRKKYGSL